MPVLTADIGDTVHLPVRVYDFENIASMQMAFYWEPTALEFLSVDQFGLPDFSVINFNYSDHRLVFGWYDQTLTSVSRPDSTVIFVLNMRVKGAVSTFKPILLDNISPGIPAEVIKAPLISKSFPFTFETGGVKPVQNPSPDMQLRNTCISAANTCSLPTGSISVETISGTGPYTYSWTGPAGFVSFDQHIDSLSAGLYFLTVTDQTGNTAAGAFKVPSSNTDFVISSQVTNTSCAQNDGCINIIVNAGKSPFSFTWSDTTLNAQNACGLSPGAYSVTVTDANGCTQTDSFTVFPSNALSLNTVASDANCASGQFGTAAALPQNGVLPYQYAWATGDTTPVIIGKFSGTYTVTVTDHNGCTGTGQVDINDAAVLSWGLELIPNCPGANQPTGNMSLRAENPGNIAFPVTLHWSNGTTSIVTEPTGNTLETLAFLPSGKYSVMAIDSLGCAQMLETVLNCLLEFPADTGIAITWPGDADSNRVVNHHDLLYLGLGYGAVGPTRPNASLDWTGQPGPDWPQNTPQRVINFRHLDTNGDGIINSADTMAIINNWGQVINPFTDDPFDIPKSVPGMATSPAPALSFSTDTMLVGQSAPVPVILGSGTAPAAGLHGLSFSISYDPQILHPVYFEPLPSWFGNPANGLLCIQRHFPGQHRLDVALTRTDGVPVSGFGVIGRTFIVIEDDIFFRKQSDQPDGLSGGDDEDGVLITKLFLRGVQGLSLANRQPEIAPTVTDLVIRQSVNVPETDHSTNMAQVWPNPVSDILHIASPDHPILAIQIYDMTGRRIIETKGQEAASIDLSVSHLTPGLYWVEVQTVKGIYNKTIIRL